MGLALWLIAAIVVLLVLSFYLLFRFGCVRRGAPQPVTEDGHSSPAWGEYAPQILAGKHWYFTQAWERMEIRSYDGLKLVGYYLPAEGSCRTILLFHGYRSDAVSDFSCAYAFYHSLGLNILAVHQRAHGESEGKYICFGVRERYDCQAWANSVRERFGPDQDIFLGGLSMGATTVLMASALDLPDNVRGIIADCGFTSAHDEFVHLLRYKFRLPIHPFLEGADLVARCLAGFHFSEYSTLDAMADSRLPILFVHGGSDNFVPTWMSERNYAACVSEKELIIVPGAWHGMSYLVDTAQCQTTLKNFFERYSVCGKSK